MGILRAELFTTGPLLIEYARAFVRGSSTESIHSCPAIGSSHFVSSSLKLPPRRWLGSSSYHKAFGSFRNLGTRILRLYFLRSTKDLLIFSNNEIFNQWNLYQESYHLIEYILPTEDLEDINIIKSKFEFIEDYNFEEITKKYSLNDSVIALIFVNDQNIRLLSKISLNNELVLKNKSFSNHDLKNDDHVKKIIDEMNKNNNINFEDEFSLTSLENKKLKRNIPVNIINKRAFVCLVAPSEKGLGNSIPSK